MKVRLQIAKEGSVLYAADYDVTDADDFGAAFRHAWLKLQQIQLDRETSGGAAREHINDSVVGMLAGASIMVTKA